MKAEELMIGDWVFNTHNQQPEQVVEIREKMVMLAYNDLYDYDEIEPVPLTENILESVFPQKHFTFDYNVVDKEKQMFFGDNQLLIIVRNIAGDWEFYPIANIHYVHELQHVLNNCKIEKKIGL